MDWQYHVLIGIALAGAIAYLLGHTAVAELVPLMLFAGLSSLIPDLDHDESKGRKLLNGAVVAFAFTGVWLAGCGGSACVPSLSWAPAGLVFALAIIGAYFVAFMFFKPQHRGITHSIAACAVFGAAVWLGLGTMPALAGVAGYASHLVADREIKWL
jgi:membrane-bound metal-dependent hydrolase YbcI (DUF457 family)